MKTKIMADFQICISAPLIEFFEIIRFDGEIIRLYQLISCITLCFFTFKNSNNMMMMVMMMMSCFCRMADLWKVFSLISRQDHCQRFSPLQITDTSRAGFEPALNLRLGFVGWGCSVVITTKPQRHKLETVGIQCRIICIFRKMFFFIEEG